MSVDASATIVFGYQYDDTLERGEDNGESFDEYYDEYVHPQSSYSDDSGGVIGELMASTDYIEGIDLSEFKVDDCLVKEIKEVYKYLVGKSPEGSPKMYLMAQWW